MFKQLFDAFWPKVVDRVAEQGLNNVLNIKDSKHILEILHKNLKSLSATTFDVEKEVKNGEDSGRKKRKREVEEWLEEVKEIEKEVDELGSEAESEGFIIRFLDGGKAARLIGKVEKLLQQRLDFGEPVLDARGEIEEIFEEDEGITTTSVVATLTLPKLKQLNLHDLPRLKKVGLLVSELSNLEGISIWDCGEIEEIFKEEDEGRAASILTTLPKLKNFHLRELPKLKKVGLPASALPNLEDIGIDDCGELLMNKLPVDIDMTVAPPPSLTCLCVDREWWESLEWDMPELPQLFQSIPNFMFCGHAFSHS